MAREGGWCGEGRRGKWEGRTRVEDLLRFKTNENTPTSLSTSRTNIRIARFLRRRHSEVGS